jgi:hypothetical protein
MSMEKCRCDVGYEWKVRMAKVASFIDSPLL